jgi:hypothetical protein
MFGAKPLPNIRAAGYVDLKDELARSEATAAISSREKEQVRKLPNYRPKGRVEN